MAVLANKKKRQQIREALYKELKENGVSIPETIKKLRAILSMDQENFAKMVGISVSALRRIEQGHENYKISTLTKILQKFNLRLNIKSINTE